MLWTRYTAVDLPATTVVSAVPRDLQFVTGVTSMFVPLAAVSLLVAVGVVLKVLDEPSQVRILFGSALFAFVILESLATRDGIISSAQTWTVIIATLGLGAGAAVFVATNRAAWTGVACVGGAAACVFDDDRLGPSVCVLVVGAVLLLLADPVAHAARTTWLAVPVLAVAVLAIRLLFELQAPSPLAPAVVYATTTRVCALPENPKNGGRCATAGYVLARGEDAVLLAAVDGPRTADVRQVRCLRRVNGLLVTLPTSAVVEIQAFRREQVMGPGGEVALTLFDAALGLEREEFDDQAC